MILRRQAQFPAGHLRGHGRLRPWHGHPCVDGVRLGHVRTCRKVAAVHGRVEVELPPHAAASALSALGHVASGVWAQAAPDAVSRGLVTPPRPSPPGPAIIPALCGACGRTRSGGPADDRADQRRGRVRGADPGCWGARGSGRDGSTRVPVAVGAFTARDLPWPVAPWMEIITRAPIAARMFSRVPSTASIPTTWAPFRRMPWSSRSPGSRRLRAAVLNRSPFRVRDGSSGAAPSGVAAPDFGVASRYRRSAA